MIQPTARPLGSEPLKLAVSKGRVLEQCLPLLDAAGIRPLDDPSKSRKLVLDTNQPLLKLVIIRSQDVPTYVEYGAADFGIVGKDVLLEHEGDGLYEPLDLRIAKCRLVVAGKPEPRASGRRLRIATKYERTAKAHFAARGIQAEIIHLYGSMELAPLVELADQIVDLVETGSTLRANGLVEIETIAEISTRLVVNKASMKMKHDLINGFIDNLRTVVDSSPDAARVAATASTD